MTTSVSPSYRLGVLHGHVLAVGHNLFSRQKVKAQAVRVSDGLEGKVVVVTGGGGGIGSAVSMAFARAGARVVLASRNVGNLERVATEMRTFGADVLVVATDVTNPEQVDALVLQTVERFGRLDVLVNNSGGALQFGPPEELTVKRWRLIMALNLDAVFYGCSAAAKVMQEQGSGKIINISSKAGSEAYGASNIVGYGAAKAGVINLSESLASAWGKYNINVNCVTPGATATAGMKERGGLPTAICKDGALKSPLVLPPESEHVAELVIFLASARADRISGEVFGISSDHRLDYS